MIITCNKCSTSFNLDDSLVKKGGSKCRCTVCKHIFTVYPLPLGSEQEPEESSGLNLEPDPDDSTSFEDPGEFATKESDFALKDDDFAAESPDFEMEEIDIDSEEVELDPEEIELDSEDVELEMEEIGLDSEEIDLEMEEFGLEIEDIDIEADDDFSFEESELEIDKDSETKDLELEDNLLEFEDDGIEFKNSGEEDFDTSEFESIKKEPVSLDDEDDEIDFKPLSMDHPPQDKTLEDDLSADEDEFELEFDIEDDPENGVLDIPDNKTDNIPLEIETEPKKDFSKDDEILEQELEPEKDSPEEETIEINYPQEEEKAPVEQYEPARDLTPRSRRKKKKPSVGAPVIVILLIFLLVVGAWVASVMTGYKIPYLSDIKIPFIEQYLKKPAPEIPELKPVPNQKSVNGRFVTNSTAGTMFVITGRVENPSNIAYSYIEIRGALLTKGNKEAKIKNVFCGNIITEEMLKTGNISDINKLLAVKAGNHNSNVNVKPGTSVPFMVVFSNLPEKLQNFTIKVTRFEKAK